MFALAAAAAPPLGLWLSEALEIPGLLASPLLEPVEMERGNGQPVMVLPGYLTGDISSLRLRRSLIAANWRAYGWGLGQNLGARIDILDRLGERIDSIARRNGQPVTLVGWSLGGVFAREVAKVIPENVALVVTLGSPFSGDPHANNAWRVYEFFNDHPVDAPPLDVRLAEKPPVPTVAVWSRKDGIVAPSAARGRPGETDRHVEVNCRHLTLARAPEGIQAVGRILADHHG